MRIISWDAQGSSEGVVEDRRVKRRVSLAACAFADRVIRCDPVPTCTLSRLYSFPASLSTQLGENFHCMSLGNDLVPARLEVRKALIPLRLIHLYRGCPARKHGAQLIRGTVELNCSDACARRVLAKGMETVALRSDPTDREPQVAERSRSKKTTLKGSRAST